MPGLAFHDRPLGRREPKDFGHISKYGFAALSPRTISKVEKRLILPRWHWSHDQGYEGSCVGHGAVMERAITNTLQNRMLSIVMPSRRYDPISLWRAAKAIDEWTDTLPEDDNGTSVRAVYDILRMQGCSRVRGMKLIDGVPTPFGFKPPDVAEGVETNRWATTVDEIRYAISVGIPVTIGVNWYEGFDEPERIRYTSSRVDDWHISLRGRSRGGHCVTIYGASDARNAFRIKNSWGKQYPLVWLSYDSMNRLLREYGEACLVTDR